jgi:glycosyltransferase involved in cell wall biosynthesis
MEKNSLPTISVLIPTLNAGRVLEECLKSISIQDYPKDKIEIIIADGGSVDNTLKIAKKYGAKIFENPLKTGETGKAVALKNAKNELVALIDSDNILPNKDWLKRMVEPFDDREINGSEPWAFTYRKKDTYINRYCALIGMNDPYCYFIGNYDRFCHISGKWTGVNLKQEDKGSFVKAKIESKILPTIGANGTVWRKDILMKAVGDSDYLFDTDIPYILTRQKPFYFAKVKLGIIHDYCHRFKDFYRKQKRRAKDFFYLENKKEREDTFQKQPDKQIFFALSTITLFPLLFQAGKGFIKKNDWVWLFHPIACLTTLWVYGIETIVSRVKISEMSRKNWKQ